MAGEIKSLTSTLDDLLAPIVQEAMFVASERSVMRNLVKNFPVPRNAGKVLQCLSYTHGSGTATSSSSYVNFGSMAVTITPSATSSKILVQSSLNIYTAGSGSTTLQENRFNYNGQYKVGSGSYSAYTTEEYFGFYYYQGAQKAILAPNTLTFSKLITPSTTDALTFKYQFAVYSANGSKVEIGNSKSSTITLSEIAG